MNQEGFDAVIEAQGEAVATLHENAAGSRQSSGLNTKLIVLVILLLAGVVVFAATPSKTERQLAYELYQEAKQHEKNFAQFHFCTCQRFGGASPWRP